MAFKCPFRSKLFYASMILWQGLCLRFPRLLLQDFTEERANLGPAWPILSSTMQQLLQARCKAAEDMQMPIFFLFSFFEESCKMEEEDAGSVDTCWIPGGCAAGSLSSWWRVLETSPAIGQMQVNSKGEKQLFQPRWEDLKCRKHPWVWAQYHKGKKKHRWREHRRSHYLENW